MVTNVYSLLKYRKNVLYPTYFIIFSADSYDCVTNVIGDIDQGNINCGCKVECTEESYTVGLSTSLWPSTQYFVSFPSLHVQVMVKNIHEENEFVN